MAANPIRIPGISDGSMKIIVQALDREQRRIQESITRAVSEGRMKTARELGSREQRVRRAMGEARAVTDAYRAIREQRESQSAN